MPYNLGIIYGDFSFVRTSLLFSSYSVFTTTHRSFGDMVFPICDIQCMSATYLVGISQNTIIILCSYLERGSDEGKAEPPMDCPRDFERRFFRAAIARDIPEQYFILSH